jgi:protein TonB
LSYGSLSNRHIETSFITLLAISLLLHLAGFAVLYLWQPASTAIPEATFIDLQDLHELPLPRPEKEPELIHPSDQYRRTEQERAPRPPKTTPAPTQQGMASRVAPKPVQTAPESSSASELLRRSPSKPQPQTGQPSPSIDKLMPSAGSLAQLEDNYRRRFADDLAEGDTRFLNSDDVMFGSFLRRFENAVYGVWRYPQEAALMGVEGVTPVRITFNRNGEIVNISLLESSGSRILDDEVFRTLRLLGPMGSLPRNYQKDEFHLIAFFQYGNARGRLR